MAQGTHTGGSQATPSSGAPAAVPTDSKPLPADDYLRALASGNKFTAMVDDFMSRFGSSFEAALKERGVERNEPAAAVIAEKQGKDGPVTKIAKSAVAPAKASKPEAKMPAEKTASPLPSTVTTTTTHIGKKYDLVTIKNDKMEAGFLLPKKDKPKALAAAGNAPEKLQPPFAARGSLPPELQAADEEAPKAAKSGLAKALDASAAHARDGGDQADDGYPPKPRNFLEAALYFSTVTLGTVAMANQLDPVEFFAPPLFAGTDKAGFDAVFAERRAVAADPEGRAEESAAMRYLQRRISALFAVALNQTSPTLKPFASSLEKGGPNAAKTNYLKRSIGFFAVSLVDHLPSSMSNRLFRNGSGEIDTGLDGRSLALDDLRVPSPEALGAYWLGLPPADRLKLVQEEAAGLAKGWVNSRKAWCMCKYCKHRRLRLSDIFEHVYRAYHDELLDLECRLSGKEPPAKTAHQLKVRKLLYRALAVVAADILNTRSRLMLEAVNRLGHSYHEDVHRHCEAGGSRRRCRCPDCDMFHDEYDDDECVHDAGHDDVDDEAYDDEYSDYDDLDIEEDGDFYEDYNYGEDDAYIQAEADTAVDESQLPSSLPAFYDIDMCWQSQPVRPSADPFVDGQFLFDTLINQIFQFHLVPDYLEHQALEKQRELIREEEEAERAVAERDVHKVQAKKDKKERQRVAKLAQKRAQEEEEAQKRREVERAATLAEAAARKKEWAEVEARKREVRAAALLAKKAEPAAARAPLALVNTAAFAVEDIRPVSAVEPADGSGQPKLSKSARRKKKKAVINESESTLSQMDRSQTEGSLFDGMSVDAGPRLGDGDLPPGFFIPASVPSGTLSPSLDPPPPYSVFARDHAADEALLEPLEPLDSMTHDGYLEYEEAPTYTQADVFAPSVHDDGLPPCMSSSRFESLFRSDVRSAALPQQHPAPAPMELFDRPPFNRRFTRDLSSANDPVYCPPPYNPPPPTRAQQPKQPSPGGLEGFNPFDEWEPVRSSLFALPLYGPGHSPSPQNAAQSQSAIGPIGPSKRRL